MDDAMKIDKAAINTRRQAEKLAVKARKHGFSAIDLSSVEFISRSVADELVHQAQCYELGLRGMEGNVEEMVQAIEGSGRRELLA